MDMSWVPNKTELGRLSENGRPWGQVSCSSHYSHPIQQHKVLFVFMIIDYYVFLDSTDPTHPSTPQNHLNYHQWQDWLRNEYQEENTLKFKDDLFSASYAVQKKFILFLSFHLISCEDCV